MNDAASAGPAAVRAVHPGRSARADRRRSARGVSGDARARAAGRARDCWLWWQSLRLAVTFRWERAAHGRPLPPIGDELRGFGHMWDGLRQDIALRRADAAAAARLHRRRGLRAGARHRRQHRHLQRRRRRAVAAAAVSARRPRDVARRTAAAREPVVRAGRAGRLLRLAARQPFVLGDGGVHDSVAVGRLQPDR